jgi:hypothetical protein
MTIGALAADVNAFQAGIRPFMMPKDPRKMMILFSNYSTMSLFLYTRIARNFWNEPI